MSEETPQPVTFEQLIAGKERINCYCPSCGMTEHVQVGGCGNKPWMLCLVCREAMALDHWREKSVKELED